jgi:nucleoside-diphosphate-sugar epimerase
MIIGNGLVASEFKKQESKFKNCLIFAAGVSNSKEVDDSEFSRDKNLLISTLQKYKDLKFVYISTILAGHVDNAYYRHKLEMEELVKNYADSYIIFKVPQLVGHGGNSNTLLNYFKSRIINEEPVPVYFDSKRSLMDILDLTNMVYYFLNMADKETIIIPGIEILNAIDLCNLVATTLGKPANIVEVFIKESNDWANNQLSPQILRDLGIKKQNYTKSLLKKYLKKCH